MEKIVYKNYNKYEKTHKKKDIYIKRCLQGEIYKKTIIHRKRDKKKKINEKSDLYMNKLI